MSSSPRKNNLDHSDASNTKTSFKGRIKGFTAEEGSSSIKVLVEHLNYKQLEVHISSVQLERLVAILFKNQLIGNFEVEQRNQVPWLLKLSVKTEEIW
ncbi:MAG: hypothetical protein AAF598_05960 [Bacteroidota bacterium]